jgi:hypothetical protein
VDEMIQKQGKIIMEYYAGDTTQPQAMDIIRKLERKYQDNYFA